MTGHLIGAAGAAECVAALLACRERLVPPTANHVRTDPEITVDVVHGRAAVGHPPRGRVQLVRLRWPQRGARRRVLTLAAERGGAVDAGLRRLGDRRVGWFRLQGGKHRGAIGTVEGDTLERLVVAAADAGVPVVGIVDSSGADVTEGVGALHAWGRVARAVAAASGQVPVLVAVTGPCVSGPALLIGMADAVVMTADAFAYVSGPGAVAQFSGMVVDHDTLGGAIGHATRSGVASLVVDDEDAAVDALESMLSYLPDNCMSAPRRVSAVPVDRMPRCPTSFPGCPTSHTTSDA